MNTTRLPLLPAVVRERAQSTPDAPAVVAGASEVSYADLHALVAALNGRLRHHGVRPGDRVAILGLNSIEWVVAFLACLDAGAVAAPLSYRLSPYELEQQIALLQAAPRARRRGVPRVRRRRARGAPARRCCRSRVWTPAASRSGPAAPPAR